MQKVYFACFVLGMSLLLTLKVSGQTTISIQEGQEPISGALLEILSLNQNRKVEISNQKGEVILRDAEYPLVIKTSHLSYQTALDTLKSPQERFQIYLTPVNTQLKDVVITGQYEAASAKNSVYKVRVIDQERIRSMAAINLQQVLTQELNIRVSYDAALGESAMNLQGISGQNVRILLDGIPMAGREGSNVDLSQINMNNIERIEIVEGPMAISFGANALAGVINLITKKGGTDDVNIRVDLQEETVGTDYGLDKGIHNQSILAGIKLLPTLYAQMGMTRNFFGGYKGERTDRTFEWHPKDQWIVNGLLRYNFKKQSLHYLFDYLNESIQVNGPQQLNRTFAFDNRFITNRLSQQLVSEGEVFQNHRYQVMLGWTQFKRTTDNLRKDLFDESETLLNQDDPQREVLFNTLNARGTLNRVKHSRWINYEVGYDIQHEERGGGRIAGGIQNMTDYALFTSAEIKIGPAIKIKPGVRVAYNTKFATPPALPALHVKWALDDKTDARAGYAHGYRAPGLRELYFNFFDANHSIRGNENLKPETSRNFNGGITRRLIQKENQTLSIELSGFYNEIQDRIGYGIDPADVRILTFINIDRYTTGGGVIQLNSRYQNLQFNAGASYLGVSNTILGSPDPENGKMLYSPEVTVNLSYYLKTYRLKASIFHKYTGQTPFLEADGTGSSRVRRAGDWHMQDITLTYHIKNESIQITGGIRNLFDITQVASGNLNASVHGGGPMMQVGYGRSGFVRLTWNFSTKMS